MDQLMAHRKHIKSVYVRLHCSVFVLIRTLLSSPSEASQAHRAAVRSSSRSLVFFLFFFFGLKTDVQ